MKYAIAITALLAAGLTCGPALALAPLAASDLPNCDDPALVRPTMQTKVSLEESYPPLSTVLGEEGDVILGFIVKSNGTVKDIKVLKSSGYARLDDASTQSIQQAIYSPPKRGSDAVDCEKKLHIFWRIPEPAGNAPGPNDIAALMPPRAIYPAQALAHHAEGAAIVGLQFASDGRLLFARVVHSSGTDDLDAASLAYAKSLKVTAGTIDGKHSLSTILVTVVWTLNDEKPVPKK